MCKMLSLTKGFVSIVDDEDYDRLSQYNWYVRVTPRNVYGVRIITINKKKIRIHLHHFILGTTPKETILDHINGNSLDNRKENLRICSKKDNARNCKKRVDNKSGYKGVYKFEGKWRAMIGVSGKRVHLGMFENLIDAAKAYDQAAVKYYGEFAKLNFSED